MRTENSKQWSKCGTVMFAGGWGWIVSENLHTIGVGDEDEIRDYLKNRAVFELDDFAKWKEKKKNEARGDSLQRGVLDGSAGNKQGTATGTETQERFSLRPTRKLKSVPCR